MKHVLFAVFLLAATGASAQDHTPTVAAVKREVLARGISTANACGAFEITRRVAWAVAAEGWGLVHSDANGCVFQGEKYRADALMQRNGLTIDMLGHSESDEGDTSNPNNYNIPQWGGTGPQPGGNWREPMNPMDPGPVTPPVTPPGPPPPVVVVPPSIDLSTVYAKLAEQYAAIQRNYDQVERVYVDLAAREKALSDQLRAHDESPTWVRKFFGDGKTITAIITGLGVFIAQHQAAQ